MPKVFIGAGSNLGDRAAFLEFARKELGKVPGLARPEYSPVYESEPVDAGGGPFLNAVWSFFTELSPRELLEELQGIELRAGRQGKGTNGPRTLDLDLLFYGEQVIREPGLSVPHPRLQERAFVLVPFCDLAPDLMHPVFKKKISVLLNELSAKGKDGSSILRFVP